MKEEDASIMDDAEAPLLDNGRKKGGWITFPFILATRTGLTLAAAGWSSNLIVYLIKEFNVKSIDAAQIFNIVNGCTAFLPLFVAMIADISLGCFNVIWISSLISLLGMILFTLTATFDSLRPQPCNEGSKFCEPPSSFQFAILLLANALASIGVAGTSFTVGTMGANQLDDPKHQENFFNWFLFVWNAASVISATAIVYVQDNVSWAWGYGICAAANILGFIIFLGGRHFYRDVQPQGSPLKDLARVVVAAFSKRKIQLSPRAEDYYSESCDGADEQNDEVTAPVAAQLDQNFKCLNHAALVTLSDIQPNGSIKQSWKLCTVQQIQDLKTLIRLLPLWTTGIFLDTPMAMLTSLTTLQALTMDRKIIGGFKIPVGSMSVFPLLSGAISLTFIDRLLFPLCQRTVGKPPTPLQRLGFGHILNVLSIATGAFVESKRLQLARTKVVPDSAGSIVPMSVLWLVPQLALTGMGEAFHFPGQASLYYQEFPASLKSTSTAMLAMLIGIGYYLGTALIDVVRGVTNWLPDDLNRGRLDNVYWLLVLIGVLNFVYYLTCAALYRYRVDDNNASTSENKAVIHC